MMKVATIGFFDGVHRGHRHLVRRVLELAEGRNAQSVLVTFTVHPLDVLCPEKAPKLLTTNEERARLLQETGVDDVVMIPFSRELADMSAKDFMSQILQGELGVSTLVIGYDHHFGNAQSGHDYARYAEELGIEIVMASAVDGVSSSAIRTMLLCGDVLGANNALGYRYSLSGKVVCGHQLGRTIGYPTANIEVAPCKLLPKNGAYIVGVSTDGGSFPGMLNVGHGTVEVHLLDFSGDLYGQNIVVEFTGFLRDEVEFDSLEGLKAQLEKDEQEIRSRCGL